MRSAAGAGRAWRSRSGALRVAVLLVAASAALAGAWLRVVDPIRNPVRMRAGLGGMGDSVGYVRLADNLTEHHGFSLATGPPYGGNTTRAPGYPLFVAASFSIFGRDYSVLRAAQGGVGLLTCALALLLFARVRPDAHPVATLAVIAGVALNPSLYLIDAEILSEGLAAFLATLATFLVVLGLHRRWAMLAGGLACGLLALTRPEYLFFPLGLGGALALARLPRPARNTALLVAASALVVCPWIVRNRLASGRWIPVTDGVVGANVLIGLSWTPATFEKWSEWPRESFASDAAHRRASHLWNQYFAIFNSDDPRVRALDRQMLLLAVDQYRRQPGLVPIRAAQHLLSLWQIDPLVLHHVRPPHAVMWAILALAVVGAVSPRRGTSDPRLLLAVPAAWISLVILPLGADWRYAVPAIPTLVVLAGVGVDALLRYRVPTPR